MASVCTSRPPLQVVILGGGFAGLESAFRLRQRLGERVELTLVSDRPSFLFRPNTIYIPYGAEPDNLLLPLADPAQRQGLRLIIDRALRIDPVARQVTLAVGGPLPYDRLIIATGAALRPGELPGLAAHGGSIGALGDMRELRHRVERIVDRGQRRQATRVVFLVPPGNRCPGPLYELALMLDTHLRRSDARGAVDILCVTAEGTFLQLLGPRLHPVIQGEFQARGVTALTGRSAVEVLEGRLRFADGMELDFDELIACPPHAAQVRWDPLPLDDHGFLRTRLRDRAVLGVPTVYAPGDAGDFPLKQAFLAFLEADAVAESIAADVLEQPPGFGFEPVSMNVIEQLDKTTFASVPLALTGDPSRPVAVRDDLPDEYRVGVSPWRMGKKLLGVYLPLRFQAGQPFDARAAWGMMDVRLAG